MIQFCPISPMWCASEVDRWRPPEQTWWMCLANFCHIKEYFNYFANVKAKGGHVILDNGAYEGAMVQDTELLSVCARLLPDVVVLPDVPGKWQKTLLRSDKFYKLFVAEGLAKFTETMLVVHASGSETMDSNEAFESYKAASEMEPSWLGLSRLTPRYVLEQGAFSNTRRWRFIQYLKERGLWKEEKTHHLLGMLNGDTEEFFHLKFSGVHSCDSSAPIWRGLHGYTLQDKDWPNYDYQPMNMHGKDLRRARLNYEEVIQRCK